MGEASSLINLILLAIAVGVFFKLRSVLGRRTGEERPPFDPYSAEDKARPNDKVVQLPRPRGQQPAKDEDESSFDAYPQTEPYVVKDRWAGLAKEGSPLAGTLTEIAVADRRFDAPAFVSGAKLAYEMIVTAFAKGERATLKPLLDPHVYASFESVIAEREARGETIDQTFIGITKAELHDGSLVDRRARLTIRFVSELTACTKDREGKVIEGDPVTIRKVTDLWTFERDVKASDPNWRLVATGSED
ncbi:MAG: Tim44/TimA family putative adaptor protein [Parvibaculum sp.]|nr:Tim44/TimA family putative adaptor protein [Parvibaculum sp.]